jgi:hypothetical protein
LHVGFRRRDLDPLGAEIIGEAREGRACRLGRAGGGIGLRIECLIRAAQGPVAQGLQALAGDLEDTIAVAPAFLDGLEVELDRGDRIGKQVELFARGHTPVLQEFHLGEADDTLHQLGGFRQVHHAQGAGDLLEEARDLLDLAVVPRRLDEGNDVLLGLLDVVRGLLGRRLEDLADLGLRQLEARAGHGLAFLFGAQTLDVIVEGGFDIEQRPGDVEQGVLFRRLATGDDPFEQLLLVEHHPTRHAKTQHAERVANPVECVGLRREVVGIGAAGAQEQVQRILDAQQVFLDRGADGVEQGPVVAGQRATRVLEFGLARHQLVEPVDLTQFEHAL